MNLVPGLPPYNTRWWSKCWYQGKALFCEINFLAPNFFSVVSTLKIHQQSNYVTLHEGMNVGNRKVVPALWLVDGFYFDKNKEFVNILRKWGLKIELIIHNDRKSAFEIIFPQHRKFKNCLRIIWINVS
jgi:hypothetical protein